jgi:hypothetical protein
MALSRHDGDELFARLTELCEAREGEELERFLARLVLLLAGEVGDAGAVHRALEAAADDPGAQR